MNVPLVCSPARLTDRTALHPKIPPNLIMIYESIFKVVICCPQPPMSFPGIRHNPEGQEATGLLPPGVMEDEVEAAQDDILWGD